MSSVIKEARQMSVCNPHLLAGRSRDPAYIFYHACKNQVLMFFWLLYVYKTYLKMWNEQPDSYLSTVQNPTVFSVVLFSQMKTWNLLLKVGMSQYWEVTRGVPFKNIFLRLHIVVMDGTISLIFHDTVWSFPMSSIGIWKLSLTLEVVQSNASIYSFDGSIWRTWKATFN